MRKFLLLVLLIPCAMLISCNGRDLREKGSEVDSLSSDSGVTWITVDTLPKLEIRDELLMQGARSINAVVIHCSASAEESSMPVDSVRKEHRNRGFRDIGYHFYITRDGIIHQGRWVAEQGAHVYGHNKHTIGVCYEGGLRKASKMKGVPKIKVPKSMRQDKYSIYKEEINGKTVVVTVIRGVAYLPADTRTEAQKKSMNDLVMRLKRIYPKAVVKGHRDYSLDVNKDGKLSEDEWIKACPSFDVRREL